MNSTITSKFQTTIPKGVRERLGISIKDSLEWQVMEGKAVVMPVHNDFLRHRNSVEVGAGEIADDIAAARKHRVDTYR